jgi:hypothetical protein
MSAASARMQMDMRGRGMWGSLKRQVSEMPSPNHGFNALDGSRETLVPLGIVVLQADLELDGLNELALLLAIGLSKEFLNRAPHA